MKKRIFVPGRGPGQPGTHDPGTPRDTVTGPAPGHPGTRTRDTPGQLVFMKGGGARDLIRDTSPKRGQKYKAYRYIVVSRTQRNNKQQGPKESQKKHKRRQKRQKRKTQISLSTFSGPSPALSGPYPGFSPEFPAAGPEKIFPARGRKGPERAGENPKNHFNMALAVSAFPRLLPYSPRLSFWY